MENQIIEQCLQIKKSQKDVVGVRWIGYYILINPWENEQVITELFIQKVLDYAGYYIGFYGTSLLCCLGLNSTLH